MPQVLGLILAGVVVWAGYKLFRKHAAQIEADLHDAEEAIRQREEQQMPTLKADPETGVYRPTRK